MGFQIAPMVDVVFVLMLFFMASVGSQVNEKEIRMNLPGKSRVGSDTLIVIRINPEGFVTMNDQDFGQPTDKALLRLSDFLRGHIETFGTMVDPILRPKSWEIKLWCGRLFRGSLSADSGSTLKQR